MPSDLYDETLPSEPPFMWIESTREFVLGEEDSVFVMAFGAYNAKGLIGPELGGVAVVHHEQKFVIATKTVPHSIKSRKTEFLGTCTLLEDGLNLEKDAFELRRDLCSLLRCRGYDLRIKLPEEPLHNDETAHYKSM